MVKFDDLTLLFIFYYILTLYCTDRSPSPPFHIPSMFSGSTSLKFIVDALATLVINSINSMTILSPKIQICCFIKSQKLFQIIHSCKSHQNGKGSFQKKKKNQTYGNFHMLVDPSLPTNRKLQ